MSVLTIDNNALLQSPYLYLSAVGSGNDSEYPMGNYLRWLFRGTLGENHLPKGDYVKPQYHFNKLNDYVKIYRAPFTEPIVSTIMPLPSSLSCLSPPRTVSMDHTNQLWTYQYNGKLTHLRFLEEDKYIIVQNIFISIYPDFHKDFIQYYLENLQGIIEVEFPNDLFCSVHLFQTAISPSPLPPYDGQMEVLSVNENRESAEKYVYVRKTYTDPSSGNLDRIMICENGRSIRLQLDAGSIIPGLMPYFYDEYIADMNNSNGWEELGAFALSLDEQEVFARLEPERGLIHGNWPRFNDNAFVNIANYQDKWNGASSDPDNRNIEEVVSRYIELSRDSDNPRANEQIFIDATEEDGSPMETSLLDLLNAGAMDFHIARMLGLGTIDLDIEDPEQLYVYAAEYYTEGALNDGLKPRTVQHLYLSLPTAIETERLPKITEITEIVPGILNPDNPDEHITFNDGYTPDGRSRFVTILVNEEAKDIPDPPFYASEEEFDRSEFLFPVFGGLEHKMGNEPEWQSPELANDPTYQHIGDGCNETIPLAFSDGVIDRANQRILYVHKQQASGEHHYLAYGIDLFSRSARGENVCSIAAQFKATLLRPPVNINALLIRKELPLLLTSMEEQDRYDAIIGNDKTLIRLIFDYHSEQELSVYQIDEEYSHLIYDADIVNDTNIYPDNFEIYADEIELFFRKSAPENVSGKAIDVIDSGPLTATVITDKYPLASQGAGQYLVPHLPSSEQGKYIGGVFSIGGEQFIIASIDSSNPDKPEITVYKKEISGSFASSETPEVDADNLQLPRITPDSLFTAIENMQTTSNWGQNNPHSLKVQIGTPSWQVHREVYHTIVDGEDVRFLEKSRGFWEEVTIEQVEEPVEYDNAGVTNIVNEFRGLYKLIFVNFQLPGHSQYSANSDSVEWHKGIVRLKRQDALASTGARDVFEVIKMDNSGQNLILYIHDSSYSDTPEYDDIKIPTDPQLINYYPGYKVYLYADSANLTEGNILPNQGEEVRYSIFGLRGINSETNSKLSPPTLMFAQEIVEPVPPTLPKTSDYATRPDFFGRASYTLRPEFTRKPNSILFYRSNDEAFLNALYEKSTMEEIREALETLGGNDEALLTNRWENFLKFDYDFATPPQNVQYATFDGYKFPMPDNELFIAAINEFIDWYKTAYNNPNIDNITAVTSLDQLIIPEVTGKQNELRAIDFIRETIYNSFVPLTEMPVVYQHIKPEPYKPQPKKQHIKDAGGYMLQPSDPEFDMAPMAVKDETISNKLIVTFTDFTLDGTSKNVYFYGVREMNLQMKMSEFGSIIGPIKLVNTNPPDAPEIRMAVPVLENRIIGIAPAIQFEINAYPKNQYIRKVTLYRALNPLDAQSIRSMAKAKEIDIEQAGMLQDDTWIFHDDFSDLAEIPYGMPLYYRLTVSRQVEYIEEGIPDAITEYAPSQPSKIVLTLIPDASAPESPVLSYTSGQLDNGELPEVALSWDKTVHNGKYHVYKMNLQGNWIAIKEIVANNDAVIALSLADTTLESDILQMLDEDGQALYHHFKAVAENSSGMLSSDEHILTLGG